MWPSRRRHRRQPNMGLMLLLLQLCQAGFDTIPPVTLGTIALNVGMYLGIIHEFFRKRVPRTMDICVGVVQVWQRQDYWRVIEATFTHADDWHLYYNMVSFLWKGRSLESKIGSRQFLYMLAVFSVLVNVVMLYLNYAAAMFFSDASYMNQCAVGFSGVVFAVKVVTTQMMPQGTSLIMGFIPVNSRLSCWFELVLIQVLVPNASFTGHLAGILVGLAYVKGPLKAVMNWPFNDFGRSFSARSGPSYTYHSASSGHHNRQSPVQDERRYDSYTGGLNEQQQMEHAMAQSTQNQPNNGQNRLYPDLSEETSPSAPTQDEVQPPAYGWNIPGHTHNTQNETPTNGQPPYPPASNQDELRRRRLDHYNHRASNRR
uniref:Rhomboid-related protein 4-like n=1 Tax=Phallusia mammillata TaxID=59560 RepID=A0A6F9DRE1_9ASCI|nr:rhomboid-related protein 4-like [Phallusia mammillata]